MKDLKLLKYQMNKYYLEPIRKVVDFNWVICKLPLIDKAKLYCISFEMYWYQRTQELISRTPYLTLYGIGSLHCYGHHQYLGRKRLVVQEWMTERLWVLFSTSYVQAVSGMLYQEVLALPVHDRFQEWRKAGVFQANVYDKKTGIDWKWQAMDGVITKAPLGGKKHRTKSHRQS